MAPQLGCPACICFPAPEEPLLVICSTIGLPVLRVESLPTSMLPLPTTAILVLMDGVNAQSRIKLHAQKLSRPRIGCGSRLAGSNIAGVDLRHIGPARPMSQ